MPARGRRPRRRARARAGRDGGIEMQRAFEEPAGEYVGIADEPRQPRRGMIEARMRGARDQHQRAAGHPVERDERVPPVVDDHVGAARDHKKRYVRGAEETRLEHRHWPRDRYRRRDARIAKTRMEGRECRGQAAERMAHDGDPRRIDRRQVRHARVAGEQPVDQEADVGRLTDHVRRPWRRRAPRASSSDASRRPPCSRGSRDDARRRWRRRGSQGIRGLGRRAAWGRAPPPATRSWRPACGRAHRHGARGSARGHATDQRRNGSRSRCRSATTVPPRAGHIRSRSMPARRGQRSKDESTTCASSDTLRERQRRRLLRGTEEPLLRHASSAASIQPARQPRGRLLCWASSRARNRGDATSRYASATRLVTAFQSGRLSMRTPIQPFCPT